MSVTPNNKVIMLLRWGLPIGAIFVFCLYSYNPAPALAFAIGIIMIVVVTYRNTLTHEGGVWRFFSGNESRAILLILALFATYAFVELRAIDAINLNNNKALLEKLDASNKDSLQRLDSIDNKLATTTNGRLATASRDIHEAFKTTCESASKKIRAAFIVPSQPRSSKYLTDEIIKLMKTKDKLVYEVVFIVDKNIINSGNVNKFDEIIENEWSKKFSDEDLDERFELRIIQSETPLNLDVLIADDNDVYLSFFNRQANKPTLADYKSDQVIVYKNQRDTAQYFGEWFIKSIWERAQKFHDWKYSRVLPN